MSCGCEQPVKTELWTPIPDYRQPTDILPGENIDCYTKRAGTNGKNDVAEKPSNKIDNTSLSSDLNRTVDEQLALTPHPNSKTVAQWTATVGGAPLAEVLPELQFNSTTGKLSGQVDAANCNKNYKVLITAKDAAGADIDSREFNFYPKEGGKEDTIKFVFPYAPNGRITCAHGPRVPPAPGASSAHKGIDISQPGSELGDILAAADGTVVKCGPARGFGNWIVIEHRDAQNVLVATTVYGHMNTFYVTVGQKVAAGQKIAKEGNAGIGSASHLHFEVHKGCWGNPVDPVPYLNGSFTIANNNVPGQNGVADPAAGEKTVNNTSERGMTTSEANGGQAGLGTNSANKDCPTILPNQEPPTSLSNPEPETVPVSTAPTKTGEAAPATVSQLEARAEVDRALNEYRDVQGQPLTEADKKHLRFVALIESNYKADAKNPQSSARGIFQMLDKTAERYYAKIGVEPTLANRNNPYLATKAQIEFYKLEQLKYYEEFKQRGTLSGKTPPPEAAERYTVMTQGEFIYGLIHHDGVGNAARGKDLQGVDYYRSKIRSQA